MILKRKKIARKYNMEFIRKSDNAARWCTNCKYFNGGTGRMCDLKFSKLYPTVSIYGICIKVIPEEKANKLKNHVYILLKREED